MQKNLVEQMMVPPRNLESIITLKKKVFADGVFSLLKVGQTIIETIEAVTLIPAIALL